MIRVLVLLVAIAAFAVLAGCESVEPLRVRIFEPHILAVTAPDSLAAGDSLRVVIHWARACSNLDRIYYSDPDSAALTLRLRASELADLSCSIALHAEEAVAVFPPPPPGDVHLTVGEAHPITFTVAVGAAPSGGDRQRIEYEPLPTGSPVAPYAVQWIDGGVPRSDTLWFDLAGHAELALSCPGATVTRRLQVVAPPYSRDLMFGRRASCGRPQVTKLGAP